MTGEEMERAIEFLLKSQAKTEAQVAETNRQLAETNRQLAETDRQLADYAQTQSEFIRATKESITGLSEAQAKTDERLNKLIRLFEQHITVGH